MEFIDIILGALFALALFKGIRNGLFIELASLLSLLIGIYFAVKFSSFMKNILEGFVHWNPHTIQVAAFVFTFIAVVIGISILAKVLTQVNNLAFLGWLNKLGGGVFRVLKTVLIVSVVFTIFEKINFHNYLAKKEALDRSLFYNPIQKTAGYIFPSLEKWYDDLKKKG
ncbi:membrane protein required for colicin V production [Flavobacterium sp. CG_23.5]|uniref:CvpA family protein n=1 Tax=Flavobacterium sp. CG_23.5 TaxID=2760708 RepID=UPI001AE52252|nr:CvpA family protein [Flavobacterium sp. CG_23.5]MBP2283746.1 membrane protein required for colicin V production [Flavobacterium sp. CG_23.5]